MAMFYLHTPSFRILDSHMDMSITSTIFTSMTYFFKSYFRSICFFNTRTDSLSSSILTLTFPFPVSSIIRNILILSSYTTIRCSSGWLRSVISRMKFTLPIDLLRRTTTYLSFFCWITFAI